MGNYRFRLSDMMPNAWFYKLKDLSRGSSRNQRIPHPTKRRTPSSPKKKQKPLPPPSSKNQAFLPNRASYYFPRSETEKLPKSTINSPRKSKSSTKLVNSSVSSTCGCRALSPEFSDEFLIDEDGNLKKPISDSVSEIQLPPILTKPTKIEAEPIKYYERPPNKKSSFSKKSPAGLHRLRLRTSSPRLASKKKIEAFRARRSFGLPASFAVLKLSSDPQRDFRDSMVEMIVENNIRASKDLEELLACYLVLNSNEYHDVIVKVFEQIWFELTDIIRL